MPINNLFWGEWIVPGSQPVLVFPITHNRIKANVNLDVELNSSGSGSGGISCESGTQDFTFSDSESGTAIGTIGNAFGHFGVDGYMIDTPISGQLGNLQVNVSKDGGPFVAGAGVLAEIGNGYYSYIPATTETEQAGQWLSSNTGALFIRVNPIDPLTDSDFYIQETAIYCRIKPTGNIPVNIPPNNAASFTELLQPQTDELKAFIQSAIRDLLGNQLTTKPTLRRD